jgi:predicted RNase H-like HicB family nuclease
VREKPTNNDVTSARTFRIQVERSKEGVWTATCDHIPGLNIESDTREDAIREARAWAPELLRANGIVADDDV